MSEEGLDEDCLSITEYSTQTHTDWALFLEIVMSRKHKGCFSFIFLTISCPSTSLFTAVLLMKRVDSLCFATDIFSFVMFKYNYYRETQFESWLLPTFAHQLSSWPETLCIFFLTNPVYPLHYRFACIVINVDDSETWGNGIWVQAIPQQRI